MDPAKRDDIYEKGKEENRHDRLAFLGSLAAGLAHEIKNPLSTMSITLQLMKEDLKDSKSAREKRNLKKIEVLEQEVQHLVEILEDFLRFARGQKLKLEPRDIHRILEEVIDFSYPEAARRGIQIRTFFDNAIPLVPIDKKQLKQALLNLFINAQQAMEGNEGGKELLIRTTLEKDTYRIDITDTGEGISKERMARVFDVYYSTKKGGTGLGLPSARKIVEEHGGELTVQSDLGKGTNISIFLPLTIPREKVSAP